MTVKSSLQILKVLTNCLFMLPFFFLGACEQKKDQGVFHHQSFTLENGLCVYFIENKLSPLVNIHVFYKIGTADDPRAEHGLSHFLEHLMFKGTKRFPKNSLDQLFSRQGVVFNAFTTQDLTAYTSTGAADQLELVLCLEADRMTNLSFTAEDVKKEREVVHEERAMRMDNNPFGAAQEEYLQALYGHHPYATPPIGYKEHIDAYTFESARKHYTKYYHPNNAFIVITGNVDFEKVKTLVTHYFASIPRGDAVIRADRTGEYPTSSSTLRHTSPRIKLTAFTMSYRAPNFKSKGKEHGFPLIVLEQILTGNQLSRFYKYFVEDTKIAGSMGSDYTYTSFDPQSFSFHMTMLPGISGEKGFELLKGEIKKLLETGVTEEELMRAKRDLVADFAFVTDDVTEPAQYFDALATDYPIDHIEHWDRDIKNITLEQVNGAARFLFEKEPDVVLFLSPEKT